MPETKKVDGKGQAAVAEKKETPTASQVAPVQDSAPLQVKLTPEQLLAEQTRLVKEAAERSMFDPAGAAKLYRSLQNLMKTQGVALQEAAQAKLSTHMQTIRETAQEAHEVIVAYAKENNLPAFTVNLPYGFTGDNPLETNRLNSLGFNWGTSSVKPVRIRTGHKRSGTLSKDGKELGKFDSATAAAKKMNVSLTETSSKGNVYDVPATKALDKAGYTWVPDAA